MVGPVRVERGGWYLRLKERVGIREVRLGRGDEP
jgi:hypothetical protein